MATVELDDTDVRILQALQIDASQSIAELSEQIHLSSNACWRRIKRLETEGVIKARVALVDVNRIGGALVVLVTLKTRDHSDEWLRRFAATVRAIPNVMEFYRLSGELDYFLKLYARDVADYDDIYKRLIAVGGLTDVSASFMLEELKSTTVAPVMQLR